MQTKVLWAMWCCGVDREGSVGQSTGSLGSGVSFSPSVSLYPSARSPLLARLLARPPILAWEVDAAARSLISDGLEFLSLCADANARVLLRPCEIDSVVRRPSSVVVIFLPPTAALRPSLGLSAVRSALH